MTPSRSCFGESLQIRKTEAGALVTVQGGPDGPLSLKEYRIHACQWDSLVCSLYEDLYLNDWKHRFEDPDVLDGEEWKLVILLTGGRKRVYSGTNAYPPYWEKLESLVRRFRRDRRVG